MTDIPMTPAQDLTALDLPFPSLEETPATLLRRLRELAPEVRAQMAASGTVDMFCSRPLVTLPYPRRFGLWEAARSAVPFVWMINRMFVVRWHERDGTTRTLVAEPSDYDLGANTPFLARSVDRLPISHDRALDWFFTRHGNVTGHLAELGIQADEVDYLSFDHLHTQDIRRLVGTTTPQPDLGYPDGPVPPLFPRARLVVTGDELRHVVDVHPFQARFHQPDTYRDIDQSRLLVTDDSVLLGPGVALIRTPGHTLGNHTLVVNTAERGIFTSSENGIAADAYAPAHSKIPGVADWASEWGYEVVLNFNTPEFASWQYNSMVLEKLIADPVPDAPQFPQCAPSSELTTHRLAPGIRPTYSHGDLTVGGVR